VAVPLLNVTGEPAAVPSTLNCTVPVGVAVPLAADAVALMVTDWPTIEGFSEEESFVVVPIRPVPPSAIIWVAFPTFRLLSVNRSEPEIVPATAGVKLTGSEQLAPEASVPALVAV
jgi:hypothetical protein